MSEQFDPADYSFVVKRRGNPQKPWRWEIYCAGKSAPVERSSVFFESMAEAAKEGKRRSDASYPNGRPEIVPHPRDRDALQLMARPRDSIAKDCEDRVISKAVRELLDRICQETIR